MHKQKPYSHRSFKFHIIKLIHFFASSTYELFCHGSVLILCPFAHLDALAVSACVLKAQGLWCILVEQLGEQKHTVQLVYRFTREVFLMY